MVVLTNGNSAYCITASIGVIEIVLYNTNRLLYTDAQLKLVAKKFCSTSLINERTNGDDLNLCSIINGLMIIFGQIDLFIRLGDLRTKETLNVVEIL